MDAIELSRLQECERVIERGLKTFTDVGNALLEIRDSKLYRAEYGTFEDYCRDRWGWERRHAYRMIEATQAVENVSNWTQLPPPANEAQARPLTKLEPEQQREVWQQVIDTAPMGVITAAHVQNVVDDYRSITRPENLHVSDDSYEWYTPREYIDAARFVMDGIDLDPASSPEAQNIIMAGKFYTKKQDGLALPWFGKVWINPPYSMPDIENFSDRVIIEYNTGNIDSAIILTNNCTDAGWFHRLLNASGIACLTKGRVKFWGPHATQARQGQVLFYFGNNPELFYENFKQFGLVVCVK